MKKGSIVSLIFSCILFVLGVGFVIASFRQALAPVSIQHFAEGFSMRLSISNLTMAISSISLMFLILGSNLIISSILLLFLSCYLNVSSKKVYTSDQGNIEIKDKKVKASKDDEKKEEESKKEVIEIQPTQEEEKE